MEQNYCFQLLAPQTELNFGRTEVNDRLYQERLAAVQKLRGRVYLERGALQPEEIEPDGCFPMAGDNQSWHLLLIDAHDAVVGCARYSVYPRAATFDQLRIFDSVSKNTSSSHEAVRLLVEPDLEIARQQELSCVEVGGWALAKAWRGTKAALETLLTCYALGELWGGSLLLCLTAVQHGAPSVLRRIGGLGFGLSGHPWHASADSRYGHALESIKLELIKIDSRSPAPHFVPLINQIVRQLSQSLILRSETAQECKVSLGQLALGASAV